MLTEQRPALPFGHPAPYTELHPVVERVGTTLHLDRAVPADGRRLALRRTAHEQVIRILTTTAGL